MVDHGARDHATWSASKTERNWTCPGALALEAKVARFDKESEAAAWGTACHQIAEKCLSTGCDAGAFHGTVEQTKERLVPVDDEMAQTAQEYVNYVRSRVVSGHTQQSRRLQIEQKFSLAAINPPFDAGGTADAVIYNPNWSELEVIDLKGGRGVVVEAKGNPQLRTYALGAMLANPGLDIDTVMVTIVQPRASHKDGRVRSETFHVADLIEWSAYLLDAMHKAKAAMRDYGTMPESLWAGAYLRPGNHCDKTFCPARAICPARQQQALDAAGVWFDDLSQPHLANTPDSLDAEGLARMLDAADMVEGYFNAVRALAHNMAESGVEIPNYVLVDKVGRRVWAGDEAKVQFDLFTVLKLEEDQVFEKKLRSPAQIEKVLGAKRKAEIQHMWHTPVTGKNLVRADKTSRPAVKAAVHQHFEVIEG